MLKIKIAYKLLFSPFDKWFIQTAFTALRNAFIVSVVGGNCRKCVLLKKDNPSKYDAGYFCTYDSCLGVIKCFLNIFGILNQRYKYNFILLKESIWAINRHAKRNRS